MPNRPSSLRQFFEASGGAMSMSRLLSFLSFFPASYVVVKTMTEATLSWYLAAYAASYVGGKIADALGKRPNGTAGDV